MTDADCADDLALLENTPTHSESILQAMGVIGLDLNAIKTDFIRLKRNHLHSKWLTSKIRRLFHIPWQ